MALYRNVAPLIRPRTVAVIGASATRRTQGNGVIQNLQQVGFAGRILPVHGTAAAIDGLEAVGAIKDLPADTDVAVVAIPAPGVTDALAQLDRAGVRSAVVFSNGFAPEDEAAFRCLAGGSSMAIHGPNCMGLINFSDSVRLYPSTVTEKIRPGKVALIAQSGSAAISLMNSISAGLSKVVTMGSEFQVTAPDYMCWFAEDEQTAVIGVVLESIKDPAAFADAAERIFAAGKSLVVLKVGISDVGAVAVQAHTGAMISHRDAYDCFFDRCGIPVVHDYDELVMSLECFATCRAVARGSRLGVVGISGGETALACDLAAGLGIPVATFGAETMARVHAVLSGSSGGNPLDLGSTVHHSMEQDAVAIDAILADPGVDALLVVQDAQASLTPTMLGNYMSRILAYGKHGRDASKPVVMVSPTSENTHPRIHAELEPSGVPVLRGLRPGLVALRNLGRLDTRAALDLGWRRACGDRSELLRREIGGLSGPLPGDVVTKILTAYGIPLVRSAIARTAEEAVSCAAAIGYPVVLKITSRNVPHRSDVGGVELGIGDARALRGAIDRMLRNVRAAMPEVEIEGFELQEELTGRVEAMAGFVATPPFGALIIVGTGGTLVELEGDRAVGLSPVSPARAAAMIGGTRLGVRLGGYRNLMPRTDLDGLADLLSNLSEMAFDLCGEIAECDLNPVLVRTGTGEVRVVDALLVAGRRA